MKKIGYIILSVSMMVSLSSCDKTTHFDPDATQEPINFTAGGGGLFKIDTQTSETTQENINNFGVYVYKHTGGFNPSESTPAFMFNRGVTKSNNEWGYDPVEYWPTDGDKLSFFAYSPYVNENSKDSLTLSSVEKKGYPQFTYTVPDDIPTQRDLLISDPQLDLTVDRVPGNGVLPIKFQHALSNIVFQAKLSTNTTTREIKITSIEIGNLKNKATYNYNKDGGPDPGWDIDDEAEDKTYKLELEKGLENILLNSTDYQNLSAENYNLMVLPQTIDDDSEITITIEQNKNGATTKDTVYAKLNDTEPAITALEMGIKYNIQITISVNTTIKLTCISLPWDEKVIDVPDFK